MAEGAIEVRFHNCREGGGGGDLRTCLLELQGEWVPLLPIDSWSDRTARAVDGRRLALVRWDGEASPWSAFRVFVLDLDLRLVVRGPHVEGRCEALWFSDDGTLWWRTTDGAIGRVDGH